MHKAKTKVIEINPTQVKIRYLDKKGNVIKDTCQDCIPYLFEARFKGVKIDPIQVIKIEFPVHDYRQAATKPLKVKVTVADISKAEIAHRRNTWLRYKQK